MSLVKGAMLLLLLLAVIGINAAPGPEDCDGLNKTLSAPDLHKIYGHWDLVWAVTDNSSMVDLMAKLHYSSATLLLHQDNNTILFNKRNLFQGDSSVSYSLKMSRPADPLEAETYLLETGDATVNATATVTALSERGKINVFESCDICLVMDYQGTSGHFLLIYWRTRLSFTDRHLEEKNPVHEKLARCVGLPHDKPYTYFRYRNILPDHLTTVSQVVEQVGQ